jgi:hypothetical protein
VKTGTLGTPPTAARNGSSPRAPSCSSYSRTIGEGDKSDHPSRWQSHCSAEKGARVRDRNTSYSARARQTLARVQRTRYCNVQVALCDVDRFSCPHRRLRQYFTEAGLTWVDVHARYVDDVTRLNAGARTLTYSRFTQYVHYHFPGVMLTRTT